MIDIENLVVDKVFRAVNADYPNAVCYAEYVEMPEAFPCVTLYEADNRSYRPSDDNQLSDHQCSVMYECNVYSDKQTGKKAEAKAIADIVDATMLSMKFSRNMRSQIPNQDRTIYRVTMRFEAVVGEPIVTSSGTTTLQMYRS